jgi:hypothetical protein
VKKITGQREANTLKVILLFALLNSSFFIAFGGSGALRLLFAFLMNISGLLLGYTFIQKRNRFKTAKVGRYFRFLLLFLLGWALFTLLRSFAFNGKTLITLFGHYLMGWAWLTPLAVIFGFNILNWLRIFNVSSIVLSIVSVFGIFCFLYPLPKSYGLIEFYAFLPILLLTWFFQKKRNKRIVMFSTVVYVFISIIISQRANILFILLLLFFWFIQFLRQTELKPTKKILAILILLAGSIMMLLRMDAYYDKIMSNEEVTTDTRTFLFEELFMDLSPKEQWVGRGALGTYYSPYFEYIAQQGLEGDSETRSVNEVGYLQMILKGGYVMMLLYLLILLPAAFLGIFRSKNIIAKMCGYFILAYLIIWGISYYPVYSAEYLLVWMAAGTVMSKRNRSITNKQLLYKNRNNLNFIKV